MKSRNVLFRPSILILLALTALLASCSYHHKLGEREKIFETGGEDLSIFHRVAEQDGGLGLKFPGYIIGIEKAPREKIGWYEILNEEELGKKNKEYIKNVRKILKGPKRTFISHIVEYSLENKGGCIPNIKEDFIFNAYDKCICEHPEGIYSQGIEALREFKKEIVEDFEDKKRSETGHTHIFLYSMGWNTDQQESLRNYNSLLSLLIKGYKGEKPFRPLFIGISWPSEWRWKYFGDFVRLLSYGNKADDADEVGMFWVNIILRDILVPMKKTKNIPLILIGHSFGARVVTRAVFSNGLANIKIDNKSAEPLTDDIDLVIGLQGAFSINRFIPEESKEGSPYSEFSRYAKKFVFTWSEHDFANPMSRWITGAENVGGIYGYKRSLEFDKFDHFTINVNDNLMCSYDFDYDGIKEKQEWSQSFSRPEKISIVDASNLIRNNPYDKGGYAHSDIYTPGIARFIWDCIDNL